MRPQPQPLQNIQTGLRSSEALSGSRPAELMMQQPGKDKGYNKYTGGLRYEHFYTPICSLPLEGDMLTVAYLAYRTICIVLHS